MKIKLYFLINGFGEGGAQRQCIYLLNQLQKDERFDLHLIHFYDGFYFSLLASENIKIHKIKYKSFYDPMNILKLSKAVGDDSAIVFSWLRSADFYAFFLKIFKPNIIWIMAERNSRYPNGLLFNLRKKITVKADAVIANSVNGVSYWLKNGLDENKVFKVQNAFIAETIKEGALVNGKINIVYAGRFENQKNILKTAEFLSRYIDERENVMVHFFGNGTLENELRSYFPKWIGSRVVIRPFEDRIVDYFWSADIFISLSNYEGMPNSVVENAALGTKMLLSDIPEHKDIVGDNYRFLLPLNFTYEQARNLLDKLIELPSKDVQYEHINSILAEASLELISKKYADIFDSVVGEK